MELSIVIVNHNTQGLTLRCIESVKRFKPSTSHEIIVIDNGSDSPFPSSQDYTLIENKENLGFAKANNQGIKIAKGKSVLLLNSDAEVKKDSIDKLLEFAKANPDAGAVGPKLLNKDGSPQSSVYHFPTIAGAIKEYWFGKKGAYQKYIPEGNAPIGVDALVMAAFLITPVCLKKAGLLSEKYFMYFEDLDYCRKIKEAGLKIYYLPSSEVIHHHGASGQSKADDANQWRRLIPGSLIYHGFVRHYILFFVLWLGQKWQKLFSR